MASSFNALRENGLALVICKRRLKKGSLSRLFPILEIFVAEVLFVYTYGLKIGAEAGVFYILGALRVCLSDHAKA